MPAIKTFILTGFPGAGKTTVLNHLLSQIKDQRNIVVENEFGKVSIDRQLIQKKYDQLNELTSSCICCTHEEGFYDLLNELYPRSHEIDYLFIETTGVADITPVVAIFHRPDVKKNFKLVNTICVTDAEIVEDYLMEYVEVEKQITCADSIIMNKSGMVSEAYLKELQQKLVSLNPFAQIIITPDGNVDFEMMRLNADTIKIPQVLSEGSKPRHSKISTYLYETDATIDINAFKANISVTMLLYNYQIVRAKGFIKGNDGITYLFQSAGKGLSMDLYPDKKIPKTQVVFIGKNVDFTSLEAILNHIIYKPLNFKKSESSLRI